MSKLSIAARIVELGEIDTARASSAALTAGVKETLQRYFRVRKPQRAKELKAGFGARLDPQAVGDRSGASFPTKASPYDLASNNPHVIAATLFSRKRR